MATTDRFYGFTENRREIDKDMKEMVAKVKAGEPLYGHSQLTEYMQGAASRQSRYSGVFIHVMPWFNFVNHNQVCHLGNHEYFMTRNTVNADVYASTARC